MTYIVTLTAHGELVIAEAERKLLPMTPHSSDFITFKRVMSSEELAKLLKEQFKKEGQTR